MLSTKADGGILSRSGAVDYTIGKGVAPGVFCIVKPRHDRVSERMSDLKVGPGPCYALFRPYHLTSLETPLSAVRAVMHKRPDMQPLDHPVAECTALAKRDLSPGQKLGRIGERDYRGFAMSWVEEPIKLGEALTYENCVPAEDFVVTQTRRRLDQSDARFLPPAGNGAAPSRS